MSRIRMIERLNLILSMILFYVSICESVPLDLKFLNQLHQRSLDGTLGLNPFNLNQHGTFIGFLPGLGEAVVKHDQRSLFFFFFFLKTLSLMTKNSKKKNVVNSLCFCFFSTTCLLHRHLMYQATSMQNFLRLWLL